MWRFISSLFMTSCFCLELYENSEKITHRIIRGVCLPANQTAVLFKQQFKIQWIIHYEYSVFNTSSKSCWLRESRRESLSLLASLAAWISRWQYVSVHPWGPENEYLGGRMRTACQLQFVNIRSWLLLGSSIFIASSPLGHVHISTPP